MSTQHQGGAAPFIRPPRRQRRTEAKMVFDPEAEKRRQHQDTVVRFERGMNEWRGLDDKIRANTRKPTIEDFMPREGQINAMSLADVVEIGKADPEPEAGPPPIDLGHDTVDEDDTDQVGPPDIEDEDEAPLYQPAQASVPAVPVPAANAATKRAAKRTSPKNEDREAIEDVEIP